MTSCPFVIVPNRLQPPDDATLSGMVPTVWWPPSPASKEATPLTANYEPKDEDERRRKADYEAAVERLKAKIKVALVFYEIFSARLVSEWIFVGESKKTVHFNAICILGFGRNSNRHPYNLADRRRRQQSAGVSLTLLFGRFALSTRPWL